MELLGRYGTWLATHAWYAITIIIAITVVMAYFASQVDMGFSEEDFQPDNEVGAANTLVNEKYGGQGNSVSVLIIDDSNILSRESLLAQLEFQSRTTSDPVIQPQLAPTDANPAAFLSPAKLVAQSAYLQTAMSAARSFPEAPPTAGDTGANSSSPNASDVAAYQSALSSKLNNLTVEEMRTTLSGGNLTLAIPNAPMPITLGFEPYRPALLEVYLNNSPYRAAFSILLSTDYDNTTYTASKALAIVDVEAGLPDGTQLDIERKLVEHATAVEEDTKGADYRVLGDQLINEEINEATGETMALLMSLAFGFVIVILIIIYRSVIETVLNLLALLMAIVWVFGLAGMLGFRFNPAITTVPVLIIGLGIDYGIHITLRYKKELQQGRGITEGITRAEASVGFAILLATVTTIIGFSSNLSADTSTIRQFGVLSAAGIFSAFIVMITFFPAAKSLVDRRRERKGKPLVKRSKNKKGWGRLGGFFQEKGLSEEEVCESGVGCVNRGLGIGALAARKPLIPLIIVALLTVGGVYGALQLEPRYDFRDFLPEDLDLEPGAALLPD